MSTNLQNVKYFFLKEKFLEKKQKKKIIKEMRISIQGLNTVNGVMESIPEEDNSFKDEIVNFI